MMNLEDALTDVLNLRPALDSILVGAHGAHFLTGRRVRSRPKNSYRNLVTKYDQNAEKTIVGTLSARYPDVAVIAEEGRPKHCGGTAGWAWCIDPLDGTVNYAYGFPLFAVSVALLKLSASSSEPMMGMVHLPYLRETFWAIRGRGSFLNGRRIRVGRTRRLREALLATGFPYTRNWAFRENLRGFDRLLPHVRDFRRGGAAAVDLAFVSCGRLDGYFESGLNPWDVASGGLLVSESGGIVTDGSGGKDWLFGRRLVASNGHLHQRLLRELRS